MGLEILELVLPVFGTVFMQHCDKSDVSRGQDILRKSRLLPPVQLGQSTDMHSYCGVANALQIHMLVVVV